MSTTTVGPTLTGRQLSDTLLHLSVNDTDQPRHCLFVDIIRPAALARVMAGVIAVGHYLTQSFKFIRDKNWKIIE